MLITPQDLLDRGYQTNILPTGGLEYSKPIGHDAHIVISFLYDDPIVSIRAPYQISALPHIRTLQQLGYLEKMFGVA